MDQFSDGRFLTACATNEFISNINHALKQRGRTSYVSALDHLDRSAFQEPQLFQSFYESFSTDKKRDKECQG